MRAVAIGGIAAACALVLASGAASAQVSADARPTVAVMHFTNGALINHAEYEPLSKGIAELLITDLAANQGIRVVERERLQDVLAEQKLQTVAEIDKATAVQLGKLLGAHHFLVGGYVIDPKQRLRLDLRCINVETGQVEYVETVQGRASDVLELIAKLSDKVTRGLALPSIASRADTRFGPGDAKDPLRLAVQLGRALAARDSGNVPGAIAAYNDVLASYPNFERARALLAELQKR